MTDYKAIHGKTVQSLASDPDTAEKIQDQLELKLQI